jgi:hypothetical protein
MVRANEQHNQTSVVSHYGTVALHPLCVHTLSIAHECTAWSIVCSSYMLQFVSYLMSYSSCNAIATRSTHVIRIIVILHRYGIV